MTTARVRVVSHNAIPEERCREQVVNVTRVFIAHGGSDQFRNLTVAVFAGEVVFVAPERRGECLVLESLRQLQPASIFCVDVQVDEHLVHAAMLGVEHLLHLQIIKRCDDLLGPHRKSRFDFQRERISGVAVCIAQTGERFVQCVPRRPETVEIEAARHDLAFRQTCERFTQPFQRADVPVAVLPLHLVEFAHDIVSALFEARVTRRPEHQRYRGEMMARDVSREIATAAIPATVRFRFRFEPGAQSIKREHAIGIERQQIRCGDLLRMLQRTTGQSHFVERNGPRTQMRFGPFAIDVRR